MTQEEVHELHEHAEEAHHDPRLMPVTVAMAILAVLVAAVGLLGHRAHTEEVLLQTRATDQWAYFQAKNIRQNNYELFADLLSVFKIQANGKADVLREKYERKIERYKVEQKQIEDEARQLERETSLERRKADRFDLGEVCLEAALVITSITLLTRRRLFFVVGLAAGSLGVAIALTGLWVPLLG